MSSSSGRPAPTESLLGRAYRAERPGLLRFLRRKVDPDLATDLLHEVFVRALGSPDADRLANPAAFLRKVAGNLLIDRARHAARHPAPLALAETEDPAAAPEQGLALEAAELLALYEAAVRQLSPRTREVFLMHRVDGHTYREIHEALGISVATVEYHMMKAIAAIARAVEPAR